MLKLILIILLISYILKQTKSQIINLTSDNLEIVCNCNPMLMVYLQNKNISSIDSKTFNSLPTILSLLLNFNQITTIHPDTFKNLKSLNSLLLGNNQIKTIDSSTFNGLISLEFLYLNNNEINKIEEGLFKDLFKLKTLNLESNRIISLSKNALINSNNLFEVCLSDNPISILFPSLLTSFCNNSNDLSCKVYLNTKCL